MRITNNMIINKIMIILSLSNVCEFPCLPLEIAI